MVLFAPEHVKGGAGFVSGVFELFVTEETSGTSREERRQGAEGRNNISEYFSTEAE